MNLNSLMNDGQVQAYFSDAAMAEITYQTSGITADVSTGGVRINMIPKDGGNIFSGQAFVGGTDGDWQAEQRDRRAAGARAAHRARASRRSPDFNVGVGGPIMKDKLWFFASWRRIATDSVIPGSYFARHGRGRHRRRGSVDSEQDGPPDLAGRTRRTSSASTTTAIRSSKGTKSIVGVDRRMGHGGRAGAIPEHAHLLHRPGEVDLDDQQQAAARSRLSRPTSSTSTSATSRACRRSATRPSGSTPSARATCITLQAYDGRITPANGIDPKAQHRHQPCCRTSPAATP